MKHLKAFDEEEFKQKLGISEDNLVSDDIIDAYYKKIKRRVDEIKSMSDPSERRVKQDPIIEFWTDQLTKINGKIPSRIQLLLIQQ